VWFVKEGNSSSSDLESIQLRFLYNRERWRDYARNQSIRNYIALLQITTQRRSRPTAKRKSEVLDSERNWEQIVGLYTQQRGWRKFRWEQEYRPNYPRYRLMNEDLFVTERESGSWQKWILCLQKRRLARDSNGDLFLTEKDTIYSWQKERFASDIKGDFVRFTAEKDTLFVTE